ncbi:NUDIX hydrolase [Mobilicoccus massiliensis]|uniref:NUDIX hydrolase n=1 Tax=Mobilicoccus massiliensis TaxID=1522310 RepID=UPI000AC22FDE|nr:CoA pyrophosphatase [Mobilicoccus massiliensis]
MIARPPWLDRVAAESERAPAGFFDRHRPAGRGDRASAVLMLVGPNRERAGDQIVVLTERAAGLRSHAGQVAFPGGRVDPADGGPVAAALREAGEEVALDAAGVDIVTTFPAVHVPVSNSAVTPVLGWWQRPAAVRVNSPAEVERVVLASVAELADPANRFTVTHPVGYTGVGFEIEGLFVWGFTAALLDRLLVLAGLERPWDPAVTRVLPDRVSAGRAPMTSEPPRDPAAIVAEEADEGGQGHDRPGR